MIEQNRAKTRKETEQGRTRIKTNQNRAGQGEAWSGHNRTKAGRLNHVKTLLEKNGKKARDYNSHWGGPAQEGASL